MTTAIGVSRSGFWIILTLSYALWGEATLGTPTFLQLTVYSFRQGGKHLCFRVFLQSPPPAGCPVVGSGQTHFDFTSIDIDFGVTFFVLKTGRMLVQHPPRHVQMIVRIIVFPATGSQIEIQAAIVKTSRFCRGISQFWKCPDRKGMVNHSSASPCLICNMNILTQLTPILSQLPDTQELIQIDG